MKKSTAVGLAALGMLGWGALKALLMEAPDAPGHCPLCASSQLLSPGRLAHSVLLGPLVEEVNYRDALPRLLGDQGSAMFFGAMHASTQLSPVGNALRVLEAGLAGGLVYGTAYKKGGLLASTLVHGAHNLGVALGSYAVLRRRVEDEGWVKAPVAVLPGEHGLPPVTVMACRRSKPLKIT